MERQRGSEIGPTGETVAFNLRRIRTGAGRDLRTLSSALKSRGIALSASALSKIENLQRRVDVDELVAIALELGVNPNALLFPPAATEFWYVNVTGSAEIPADKLWDWARGEDWPEYSTGQPPKGSGVAATMEYLAAIRSTQKAKFLERSTAPQYTDSDPGPHVMHIDADGHLRPVRDPDHG